MTKSVESGFQFYHRPTDSTTEALSAATRRFGVTGESGIVYTRTGRRFFDDAKVEAEFLGVVRDALGEARETLTSVVQHQIDATTASSATAQEALNEAVSLARRAGNPVVYDLHLLLALLTQDEGIVTPLLQKAAVNVAAVRAEAERELGSKFDVKAFHDRVLENGGVTLAILRSKIERWIAETK